MHADRIMVLEQGRCVQLGTHEQLAGEPGSYRRLCEIQGALDAQIAQDLVNSSGGLFCSGGCVVSIEGDVVTQGELMLGLSARF